MTRLNEGASKPVSLMAQKCVNVNGMEWNAHLERKRQY